MIKLLLTALFLGLFLIFSIPLMLVEYLIGRKNPQLKDRSSLAIVNWAFRVIIFISGSEVEYIGKENIPTDVPVLYIGNHRSDFDIPLTYTQVPNPTGYVSKVAIKKLRLISVWMSNLHCIFMDRDNIKDGVKAIVKAVDEIKNGVSICIFPEGTRNRTTDDMLPFKEGSFKIATKSGCPIVPITINNSEAIFESHFPWIRKAHVIIEYGEPIYVDKLTKEEKKSIAHYVQNIIQQTYTKNKELV